MNNKKNRTFIEKLSDEVIDRIQSPCQIGRGWQADGEMVIEVVFEDEYVKLRNHDDNNYEASVYSIGEDYCAETPSTVSIIPKSDIGEYLSKF